MKHLLAILVVALLLVGTDLANAQPQVIIGPGLNSGRTIYHQNFNLTLYNDTTYILTGLYAVDSTYSITIEPGTVIRGDTAATLIISRGSQIFASGTVQQPIVFTSMKPAGQRSGGDWGGIVVLGGAPCNQANPVIEGGILPGTFGGGGIGQGNPDDNSGIIRYVRIEFPGYRFQVNNEVNGLTMGGVGRGTTIEYVQVSYSYDDGFEWFGGTVDAKYLVAVGGIDDEFDTDFGYQGRVQFAFGLKDPNVFEFVGGQTNGFESDNEATASYTNPRTHPRFSNLTMIGPQRTDAIVLPVGHRFEYGSVIRRGSMLSVYNSIIMGYPGGYSLRDIQSKTAAQGDTLQVRNISLQASGPLLPVHSSGTDPAGFNTSTWFNTAAYNNIGGTATRLPSTIGLVDMSSMTDPDPRPAPGSEPTTAGVEFTNLNTLAGGYFTPTTYRGAFDPSQPMSTQWTAGWTQFDPQNYDPKGTVTIGVPVAQDWNIVSVPVSAPSPDDSVNHLYVNSANPYAFAFSGGYVQTFTMAPGPGYWIKSAQAYTQNITGAPVNSLTVPVLSGWNMIGSISTSIDTSAAHVTPSAPGLRGSNYFRYNNGYVISGTIDPGSGYWVKANSAGSFFMHVTGPAAVASGDGVATGGSLEDLNTLTIQDANRGSQTLYFGTDGNSEIPVEMFAMPPKPPTGSFDARFESAEGGLMVRTHADEVDTVIDFPITVQSTAYPLTVSWRINGTVSTYALSIGAASHPIKGEGTMKNTNIEVSQLVLKVTRSSVVPKDFALSQNFPNPFNPTTQIRFSVPEPSDVRITIYNLLGQEVRTLVADRVNRGTRSVAWDGNDKNGKPVSSGTYVYRMVAGSHTQSRKMMVLK